MKNNGTTAQRHNGTTAQRHNGTTAQRHNGTTAQRHNKTFLIMLVFGLFVHFNSNVLMAQTSNSVIQYISQPTSMNVDQTKVFNYLNSLPYNDSLYFLNLASNLETNGIISLNLPSGTVNFTVNDIQFESDTSYSLTASATQGNLSLFEVNNVRGGLIDLGNVVYALYPFGQGMHVLMKYNTALIPPGTCGNAILEEDYHTPAACGTTCSEAYVDVLAMVTPEARLWLWNNWGTYSQWYLYQETHNFNLATFNSNVGNKRIRVRVASFQPDFNYYSPPYLIPDVNNLTASTIANSMLNFYKCDIGVMLTDQHYLDGFGYSNSLNFNSTNKFCIVETPFIDPIRYTFAHEVAHQFGCLHDEDFDTNSGCPHGKVLNISNDLTRFTIMCVNSDIQNVPFYSRVPYFSNPDVNYMGIATGVSGSRDNAHEIDGIAFCAVADNNSLTQYELKIENDVVCENEPLDLWAIMTPGYLIPPLGLSGLPYGIAPYQYEWTWSLNGSFNPSYYLGNQENISLSAPPYCSPFFVMCKITTADGYVIKQKKRLTCNPNCPRESKIVASNDENLIRNLYPNPSAGVVTISSKMQIEKIEIFDLNKRLLKSLDFESNSKTLELNVSNLTNGMYFIKIYDADGSSIHKLLITK